MPGTRRSSRSAVPAWRAVRRRPRAEYAARVHRVEHTSEQPMGADAVMNLATLVELACYTPRSCTPAEAERARTLASTIVATNRSQRRQPRAPAQWN